MVLAALVGDGRSQSPLKLWNHRSLSLYYWNRPFPHTESTIPHACLIAWPVGRTLPWSTLPSKFFYKSMQALPHVEYMYTSRLGNTCLDFSYSSYWGSLTSSFSNLSRSTMTSNLCAPRKADAILWGIQGLLLKEKGKRTTVVQYVSMYLTYTLNRSLSRVYSARVITRAVLVPRSCHQPRAQQ